MPKEFFGRTSSTTMDGWVYRRGAKRTVPMDVLVMGMPRTGTSCGSQPILSRAVRLKYGRADEIVLRQQWSKHSRYLGMVNRTT